MSCFVNIGHQGCMLSTGIYTLEFQCHRSCQEFFWMFCLMWNSFSWSCKLIQRSVSYAWIIMKNQLLENKYLLITHPCKIWIFSITSSADNVGLEFLLLFGFITAIMAIKSPPLLPFLNIKKKSKMWRTWFLRNFN